MRISIDDFDRSTFGMQTAIYGSLFMVSSIVFLLLMIFFVQWRPKIFLKYKISNLIHKQTDDKWVLVLEIVFWFLCSLPFIFGFVWGLMTSLTVKPVVLGIDIIFTTFSILLLLIGFMNFNKNGYQITIWNKLFIIGGASLIIILTFIDVLMMAEPSWMSGAYILVFPGLLASGLISFFKRPRISNTMILDMMHSEEKREEFVKDISSGKKDKWITTGKTPVLIMSILQLVVPILVSGLSSIMFFYYFDEYGATHISSKTTAFFSFFVDGTAIISMSTVMSGYNTNVFTIIVLILKDILISFSSRFWAIGHGFLIFLIGTFNLQNAAYNYLYPIFSESYRGIDNEHNIDGSVRSVLMNLKVYSASKVEVYSSFFLYIFYFIIGLIEVVYIKDINLEAILFDDSNCINQRDLLIVGLTLSFAVSIVIANTKILKANNWHTTAVTFPLIIMLALVYTVCFVGCDLWAYGLNIYITLGFTFFAAILHIRTYYFLWHWTYLVDILLILLSVIIYCVLIPLINRSHLSSLIISFVVVITFYYLTFFDSCDYQVKFPSFIAFIIGIILFAVYSYIVLGLIIGIAFFCFVSWVLLVTWRVNEVRKREELNGWDAIIICTSTFLIAIAATTVLFFKVSTGVKMSACIELFINVLVITVTLALFFIEEKKYVYIADGIGTLIELTIFGTFIYLAHSSFISLTTICALAFILGFAYVITSLRKTKTGYAIVFSDIFFPVRKLKNGKLKTMKSISFLFPLSFISLWIWGVFSSVFFIYPWFGILGETSALCLILFVVFYLIDKFDNTAVQSLDIIPEDGLSHVVTQAAKSANSSIIETGGEEKDDFKSFDEFKRFVKSKTNKIETSSLFASSFRAQLKITGKIEFNNSLLRVKKYLNSVKAGWSFIDVKRKYTYQESADIIKVFNAVIIVDTEEEEKRRKYQAYIDSQERKRKMANRKILKSIKSKVYLDVCQGLLENQEKYEDPDFYPKKEMKLADLEYSAGTNWVRAEDKLGGDFIYNTNALDVGQGQLGDCYLIASMAVMARNINAVRKIFEEPLIINKGVVCVNFMMNGQRVPVIVDTRILWKNSIDKPIFSRPLDLQKSSWWFLIVEKAYSKLNGSFSSIEGGQCHNALSLLTKGLPYSISLHSSEGKELIANGELEKKMLELHNKGAYLCAGSMQGDDKTTNDKGIHRGHAYSILRVVNTRGFTLLQMRNPWGESEWTGDWGDDSPMWDKYPKIKEELMVKNEDDGVFWISFKDYIDNFNTFYYLDNDSDLYEYVISGVFLPGFNDGASVASDTPSLDTVPNYLLRVNRKTKIFIKISCEDNDETRLTVMLATNGGHPLIDDYQTDDFYGCRCNDGVTFDYTIENYSEPWTLTITRDKISAKTHYSVSIFSYNYMEISNINYHPSTMPPYKIYNVRTEHVVYSNDENSLNNNDNFTVN